MCGFVLIVVYFAVFRDGICACVGIAFSPPFAFALARFNYSSESLRRMSREVAEYVPCAERMISCMFCMVTRLVSHSYVCVAVCVLHSSSLFCGAVSL